MSITCEVKDPRRFSHKNLCPEINPCSEIYLGIAKDYVDQHYQMQRDKYWKECEQIYDDIKSGKLVLY